MTQAEIEEFLGKLTPAEKALVFQQLAGTAIGSVPGIEQTPGVVGGSPRIVRTRIPVWTLVQCRNLGMSDGEILTNFPSLNAQDLVNAWHYASQYPEQILSDLLENETA